MRGGGIGVRVGHLDLGLDLEADLKAERPRGGGLQAWGIGLGVCVGGGGYAGVWRVGRGAWGGIGIWFVLEANLKAHRPPVYWSAMPHCTLCTLQVLKGPWAGGTPEPQHCPPPALPCPLAPAPRPNPHSLCAHGCTRGTQGPAQGM